MTIIIVLIAFLLGFFQLATNKYVYIPKLVKKNESITLFMILFSLIVLMGGSTKNPDTTVYKNMYTMDFYSKNSGFGYLIVFAKKLGISLDVFRLIIAIVGILLINSVVIKYVYKQYHTLFYLLYLIYPFFMDVVQVRNFLSMAILIFAFEKLVSGGKYSWIPYIILVLLASSFQIVFVVFLPFVLFRNIEESRIQKRILAIIILFFMLFFGNKLIISMITPILNNLLYSIRDAAHYLTQTTRFGAYVYWLETIINIFILYYCVRIQNQFSNETDKLYLKFSQLVFWMNIYTLMFLPLLFITIDFYRIQRNIQILNYIVYVIAIDTSRRFSDNKKQERSLKALVCIFLLYTFFWTFVRDGELNTIIQPIFQNNWIFHMSRS